MKTIRQVVAGREEDLDEEDTALFNYIRHGASPPDAYMEELLYRYPLEESVHLYRGYMFKTQEAMDAFTESIAGGTVSTRSLSSWGDNKETAFQFAMTTPAFNINPELMQMDRANPGETLMGKGGIILHTHVPAGSGIDVRLFEHKAESEVLLSPGTYKVDVVKTFRQFKEMVGEQDINELLRKLVTRHGWERMLKRGESLESYEVGGLYQYIVTQRIDDLDHTSRMLLARVAGRGKISAGYNIEVQGSIFLGDKVKVHVGSSLGLLAVGFFGDPSKARQLKEARPLIRAIGDLVDEVAAAIRANPKHELEFYGGSGSRLNQLVRYGNKETQNKYMEVLAEVYGGRYRALNQRTKEPRTDIEMKNWMEELVRTLRSIQAGIHEWRWEQASNRCQKLYWYDIHVGTVSGSGPYICRSLSACVSSQPGMQLLLPEHDFKKAQEAIATCKHCGDSPCGALVEPTEEVPKP